MLGIVAGSSKLIGVYVTFKLLSNFGLKKVQHDSFWLIRVAKFGLFTILTRTNSYTKSATRANYAK